MYLVTAATDFEMRPFKAHCSPAIKRLELITGVGLLETSLRLTSFLSTNSQKSQQAKQVRAVINFGIGGAYIQEPTEHTPHLLDICLATREVLGDFGICLAEEIEPFDPTLFAMENEFVFDQQLREQAMSIMATQQIPVHAGTFVTVNCTTGTQKRGRQLQITHNGLCENMEGAAVARVCREFDLPCLEIRCISNLVEDRNPERWRLREACNRAGQITALILRHLPIADTF